jgi:ATP-dependent RNA helicase DeaD
LLSAIEKATRKKIEIMDLPSTELINDKRIARFKQRITDTLATDDSGLFSQLVEQYQQEHNVPALEIAAALARLLQGDTPLLLQNKPQRKAAGSSRDKTQKTARPDRDRASRKGALPEAEMERYRIEVGQRHKVKPGNIVGAIANEAGLDSQHIGRITIHDDYSLVDLPKGMPKAVFTRLKKVWVSGQQLRISRVLRETGPGAPGPRARNTGQERKTVRSKHKSPRKKPLQKKKPA